MRTVQTVVVGGGGTHHEIRPQRYNGSYDGDLMHMLHGVARWEPRWYKVALVFLR